MEREAALPGGLVEHVADTKVERVAEHAIPPAGERDDLGVPSADVQQDGVIRRRVRAAALQMCDAVIASQKPDVEGKRQGSRSSRAGPAAPKGTRSLRDR